MQFHFPEGFFEKKKLDFEFSECNFKLINFWVELVNFKLYFGAFETLACHEQLKTEPQVVANSFDP